MSVKKAIARLKPIFGERITTSEPIRRQHGQSETHFSEILPDAVVFAHNTEEVSQLMAICNEQNCPVTAFAVGTSLEGHTTPLRGGISLNMMAMDKVLEIHAEDMDAVVQPGITREGLNAALKNTGLFFSVDPGANASLGGMAATRASGTTALRYGTMRDNVRALEVVLADGRIIRTGKRARKSSTGYDLTGLFVGSEGTLGIITELTLRLFGTPEAIASASCAFPSVEAAVNCVVATIQMGVPMARMELVDTSYLDAINQFNKMELPLSPHLFLEFHGSEHGVAEQAETLAEIAAEYGGADFSWRRKAEERNQLWKARHNAFGAFNATHPGTKALPTDICVPISHLAEMIEAARADIEASPIDGAILGHVGDGNFHCHLVLRDNEPDFERDLAVAKDLAHKMAERALKVDGTISGEHGIGMGKIPLMEEEHGGAWQVMGDLKRHFDPNGVLNPGKLIPSN